MHPTRRDAVGQASEISEFSVAVPPPSFLNLTEEEIDLHDRKGTAWKKEMIEHGDSRRIVCILATVDCGLFY